MKLRIEGNSVRFRLLRSEVDLLGAGKPLEAKVRFGQGPDAEFVYALEPRLQGPDIQADYTAGHLCIVLPLDRIRQWAFSEEVGIHADLNAASSYPLRFMLEKDFACLDRSDAENSDTYAHPKAGAAC